MSIKFGLLALLRSGPKYGYELKKEFEDATAEFWPLNVGQVYTTLARLMRDGLVDEEAGTASEEGQRMYRSTAQGAEALDDWFATPRPADQFERDELTIKVAMAVASGVADVEELLQSQRSAATSSLQALTRRKSRLADDDVSQAVVVDAAIARLDAEVRWLDLTSARLAGRRHGRKRT